MAHSTNSKNQDQQRETRGEQLFASLSPESMEAIERATAMSHYTRGYLTWLADASASVNADRYRGQHDYWFGRALYTLTEAVEHPIPTLYGEQRIAIDQTVTRAVVNLNMDL